MPDNQNIPKLTMSTFISKGADTARIKLNSAPAVQSAAPGWKKQESSERAAPIQKAKWQQPRRSMLKTAEDSEENRRGAGLMIKLVICACVCALALGLKLINTPETERLAKDVKDAITTEVDLDETIGKLKFVQNDSEMVFGDSAAVTLPVKGEVRQNFGDANSEGVVFGCPAGSTVVACTDGVVEALGNTQELGSYVRVRHAAGLETFSYGLSEITVEKGQPLKSGDVIGKVAGDTLYFESRVNGRPQDPLTLYNSMMG